MGSGLARQAMRYNPGSTSSVRMVEEMMPPITTVARGRWSSRYQLPGGMEPETEARRLAEVRRFFRWLEQLRRPLRC